MCCDVSSINYGANNGVSVVNWYQNSILGWSRYKISGFPFEVFCTGIIK
jgi:hypothetical protein